MCRLAAFAPSFPKQEAEKILFDFAKGNTDGVGSVHIKKGEFVVNKWPFSIYKVIRKNLPLLDHMPYPGWTLVHLRSASHGANTYNNTHPFIKGNWAFCHNGIWRDYSIVKAAYSRMFNFKGDTDSEVAAQLFTSAGPRNFIRAVKDGGVYLALHKTGKLYAICTLLGDLEFTKTPHGIVIASTLPPGYTKVTTIGEGWIKFNSRGKIDKKDFKEQDYNLYEGESWKDWDKPRKLSKEYLYGPKEIL